MELVIIPFGYLDWPEEHQNKVVPICIEAEDRYGNPIDRVWFEKGVAPISKELTDLVGALLGDKGMVSEIVQRCVQALWYKYGSNAGRNPHAQVWRRAIEEARNQAAGGWRERKFRVISWSMAELERCLPERAADPCDYSLLYEQRLRLEAVEEAISEEGLEEMASVYESILLGESWPEISAKLGKPRDALKRRFYRFCERLRRKFPKYWV